MIYHAIFILLQNDIPLDLGYIAISRSKLAFYILLCLKALNEKRFQDDYIITKIKKKDYMILVR